MTTGDRSDQGRLDDRVVEALSVREGQIAFNGLRRTLKAHPESLSRALRRLERAGTVARVDGGYRLLHSGLEPEPYEASPYRRSVAALALPQGVTPDEVNGALAGRWFSRLRWVGMFDDDSGPWLVWSVEGTDGQVLLTARSRELRVAIEPRDAAEVAPLESAAHDLLVHALERVQTGSSEKSLRLAEFRLDSHSPSRDN